MASQDASPPQDTTVAPVYCDANAHVQAGACTPCAAGTFNDAGDPESGPDTSCLANICAKDERVQGYACAPCAAGTFNDAGDTTNAGNTTCAADSCGEDAHVQDYACSACPPGQTNAAGDTTDVAGGATACDQDACYLVLGVSCGQFDQGTFKADLPMEGDEFGMATALEGDVMAIGAPWHASCPDAAPDTAACSGMGGVFIFERDGAGAWSQTSLLKPSSAAGAAYFGVSIALSGDLLAVGAPFEAAASGSDNKGAVYVYRRVTSGESATWIMERRLPPPSNGAKSIFGNSVSMDGQLLVVGAYADSSCATGINPDPAEVSCYSTGAAYTYRREIVLGQARWTQEAYIKPPTSISLGLFGISTGISAGISGDTVVVGQPGPSGYGSAHVYRRSVAGATPIWIHRATLTPSDAGNQDNFGDNVAIDDGRVAVAAYAEDSCVGDDASTNDCPQSGAVYLFEPTAGGDYSQKAMLKAPNAGDGDRLGNSYQSFFGPYANSLSLQGDTLVVGAKIEDGCGAALWGNMSSDACDGAGAAYIFRTDDGGETWEFVAYLKERSPSAGAYFGQSISQDGDDVLIGAPNRSGCAPDSDAGDCPESGAVYLRRISQ